MTARQRRNQLIEQYIPLARGLARRYCGGFSGSILDEMTGVALMGLVEAAQRWRKAKGSTFLTWASWRIWGAMQDHSRDTDPISRHTRRKMATGNNVNWYEQVVVYAGEAGESFLAKAVIEPPQEDHVDRVKFWETFERAAAHLPDRTREMLVAHFILDTRQRATGEAFGVTESRCNQLMKEALRDMAPDFAEFRPG